jgi:hypothetical protein
LLYLAATLPQRGCGLPFTIPPQIGRLFSCFLAETISIFVLRVAGMGEIVSFVSSLIVLL